MKVFTLITLASVALLAACSPPKADPHAGHSMHAQMKHDKMHSQHKKGGLICGEDGMGFNKTGPIQVYHAHANPQVQTSPGAVYFHLLNTTEQADELVSVTTPAAETTEIHETMMHGDMAMMHKVESLPIPAKGHVTLGQGGKHLMLIGLKANLKKGEKIQITLNFKNAGAITMDVPVMFPSRTKHKSGAAPMDHKHHMKQDAPMDHQNHHMKH